MIARKRTLRVAAAGAAMAMLAIGSPAVAASSHSGDHPGKVKLPISSWGGKHSQTVKITMTTANNFTAPKKLQAGWVTFQVSSPEDVYHGLEIARVNPGHTLAQVLDDLERGLSGDLTQGAAGARDLVRDGTLMGGVVTSTYAPQGVSIPMTPGTYYLFDLAEFDVSPVHVHTLKVVGHMDWSGMPRFNTVIGMYINSDDMPRFAAPTTMAGKSNILIYGQGDELHEAVWRTILPNVDDQYITDYYAASDAGLPHAPSPWTSIQHGLNAMSPGQFAVLHLNLPPGHYALVCLVPDDENGLPHSHMGMHQVMDLS